MVTLITDFVIKALNIVLLLHYKIWLWISVFFRGFVLASRRIGTGGVPRRPQQAREHLWGALRYVLERLARNCHCILLKKALLACLFVCLINLFIYLSIICHCTMSVTLQPSREVGFTKCSTILVHFDFSSVNKWGCEPKSFISITAEY